MDAKQIKQLIEKGESETLEFKTSFNDDALKSIGALSNARGGIILIGVKDSGDACGFQMGKKTPEDIANRIQEATDPRIQPSLSIIPFGNKHILAIQVAKNIGSPLSIRGRFYKRSGKTNQRMSHETIMQCITENSGLSWDAHIEPKATLKDLDVNLIDRFIKAANKLGRRPIPSHTTTEAFLQKLDLIKDKTPTRAALLIFGKNIDTYFPSAFLKIGRFRSPTLIVDDREIHGALLQQLDGAMTWFRDRLKTEFVITGKPEREVRWEYPLKAIREGLINCLCHRDFTHGVHNQIRLYDDRLELWNAGGLPSPLTPELLYQEHDSIPRNRKIAEIFFYMGLIERWGSGTLRIIEELEKTKYPEPEFISESGRFKLIFHKGKLHKIDLSERQLKAINYLKKQGSITNTEYQEVTGVSKRTASRDLSELTSKKILIPEGGSRGQGKLYRLANI